MVDDKIRTAFQKYIIKNRKNDNQGYLSDIYTYLKFLDKDQEDSDNTEYLFNVLKNIGYLAMSGFDIEDDLINRTIKHLKEHKISGISQNAPSHINFDNLYSAIIRYESMWNEFNRLIPITNIPKPGDTYDLEGQWDDMWWELYDSGLELILCGFDMEAVERGYAILNTTITNAIWEKSWNSFCENKTKFLMLLCQKEFEHRFYLISDDINKLLRKYYVCNNNNPFITFLSNVAATRETYAKENYYSHIIYSGEAKTIYQHIKYLFKGYPSGAWFSFYKCALAEITIKHFLIRICDALESDDTGIWELTSSSANDYQYTHPVLIAGCNEYSVHMLSHPRNKGWGMLKTELKSFFHPNRNDYKGAIFCSMKQYQSENILVRFENYMPKEELLRLYKMPVKEILKDYYKFSFDDVYKEDKRKEFFQEAVEAVLLPVFNGPFDYKKPIEQDQDIEDLMQINVPYAAQEKQIMESQFGSSLRPHSERDDTPKTKIIKDVVIDDLSDWNNILKSYEGLDDMNNFLKKIENMASETYSCGAAVLFTDSKIKNLGIEPVVVSERRRRKIENKLQADIGELKKDKFAIIFVGISSDKEQLKTEIDELCKAVEEERKYKHQPAKKPVIWIRYIFKCNIKAD